MIQCQVIEKRVSLPQEEMLKGSLEWITIKLDQEVILIKELKNLKSLSVNLTLMLIQSS